MVLVGNKCDLEDERVVGKELGKSLANQFNCAFMETSAKAKISVNDVSEHFYLKIIPSSVWCTYCSINLIILSLFQIFYDLVRQINRKSPEKKQKQKKKSICTLL